MDIHPQGGNGFVIPVEHDACRGKTFALKVSQARALGGQELHCDVSTLRKEYSNLTLCATNPWIVNMAHVPGHTLGLASREQDNVVEYLGIFIDWVDAVELRQAGKDPLWWSGSGLRCMQQLVEGVVMMHNAGLIHGDIKPGNVLIHRDLSRITIVDLGMTGFAMTGISKYGTPGYRAPEFTYDSLTEKKNNAARDAEAWAAGVTLSMFAIAHHHLVQREEADKDRDRAHRTDQVLAAASQTLGDWAQQLVTVGGTVKVVRAVDWKFIAKLLSYEPSGRSKAMRDLVSK